MKLRGSLEYARLNVHGATHNNNEAPSAMMRDLYHEHDPSWVAEDTPENKALAEKVGGPDFRKRQQDTGRSLLWGNGVINGPIDQLKIVEADIRAKHPDWKMSYDMHRKVLAEDDLKDFNVGDKVLFMGIGSWTGIPFVGQGEVVDADHNGWHYAQYNGQNRLAIRLKGKRKATITAAPEEKSSDVKQIAHIDSYLPESVVKKLGEQWEEVEKSEGWPISMKPVIISERHREERML